MIDDDGVIYEDVVRVPFMRTRYNYVMDDVSRETGLACKDPTMAQQQFQEECDINVIVERFGITGQLPQNMRMPIQEEFVETLTYHEALNKLIEADGEFMKLPAKIRAEFQNDAGKFVEFVSDEANYEKAREWGLAVGRESVVRPRVQDVTRPPDGGGDGSGTAA